MIIREKKRMKGLIEDVNEQDCKEMELVEEKRKKKRMGKIQNN